MNDWCQISVVINTYNAEKHLAAVLESVKDFDEVLVCDMESTDRTCEIARAYGCRCVTFPKAGHDIVEPARDFAIHEARSPWVLVVDADEVVPTALREYLYAQVNSGTAPAGIAIPRKNYFMGRFLHSAYPDHILRFFRKDAVHWPAIIHCSPVVKGTVQHIPPQRTDLAFIHLANDSVADILRKVNTYTEHELPRRRHKGYGLGALIARPAFRFFKSYILKSGWRDGMPGFIHALLDGVYQTVIVAKLIEERITRPVPTTP